MVQAHLVSYLVGSAGDGSQGVISGTEFDARVSAFLNDGWKIENFQTVQTTPLSLAINILFVRGTLATAK